MPTPIRRHTRVASAAVAALVGGSLALLPAAPSHAADLTLQWGVSRYLNEHLTSQTFGGGASEDAATGVVTFTAGEVSSAAGTRTAAYQGDARYAFTQGPTEIYSITVSDPVVTVDAAGAGTIAADVAWSVPSQGVSGSVTDTVVTTFATSTQSGGVLTATPAWAGVAPADTYGTGKPVDGQSWSVPFVKAMPASLNPFFYASGSANDAKKAPAVLTATTAASAAPATPAVSVATTATDPTTGVTVAVSGTGFTGVTNPGDNGVYVGVAPAGGLPATGSMSDQSAFVVADWVPAAALGTGAFSRTLTLPVARLTPGTSYAVYTWQAHRHSNTSQDTQTPLSIDWEALKGTSSVTATWKKKPATAKKKGKLTVAVTSPGATPSGTVTLTLTRRAAVKVKAVTRTVRSALTGGSALVTLPKLKPGRWTITVAYAGDTRVKAASSNLTVKVKKAHKTKRPARH